MIDAKTWEDAQSWELGWWKHVFHNTLNEELKQLVYAKKMGLKFAPDDHSPFWIDFEDKSVLDIGCGGSSILLKGKNIVAAVGIDPLFPSYPLWVRDRYTVNGISVISIPAEDLSDGGRFDMTLIYNVLQHTKDPEKIIKNALAISKEVRIFEWVNHAQNTGHPHVLTKEKLDSWLQGDGKVEYINENGAVGDAYYGIFPGKIS